MPHRFRNALAPLLLAALASAIVSGRQPGVTTPQWAQHPGTPAHRESVAIDGAPPIELSIVSSANTTAVARLSDTAARALRLLVEWFGPLETATLTVTDLPWSGDAPGASYPSAVATRVRMFSPARDLVAERMLIAGVARQFWFAADARAAAFREGLAIYSATRGIHAVLEGRNFAAPRVFGGFLSFPLRSVVLSPNLAGPRPLLGEFDEAIEPSEAAWRFAAAGAGAPSRRAATALQTLERIIGWPAMQQALAAARVRAGGSGVTPELFAVVLAEQRGVSMDWFVRDLVRAGESIDYAVGDIRIEPSAAGIRTIVTVERRGAGVFTGTDQPQSDGPARSLQLLTRFEDGSEIRTFVDGRAPRSEIAIDSVSRVVSATVDPGELILLDVNRANNGKLLDRAPFDRTGVRLVMNWVIWLQNAMLTYTAIA